MWWQGIKAEMLLRLGIPSRKGGGLPDAAAELWRSIVTLAEALLLAAGASGCLCAAAGALGDSGGLATGLRWPGSPATCTAQHSAWSLTVCLATAASPIPAVFLPYHMQPEALPMTASSRRFDWDQTRQRIIAHKGTSKGHSDNTQIFLGMGLLSAVKGAEALET